MFHFSHILFFFFVLKKFDLEVAKTFNKENKGKKPSDGGRNFLVFFFEQSSSLQSLQTFYQAQSRRFFKSNCKVTSRLDCMVFVDGTILFCLSEERFTEYTWICAQCSQMHMQERKNLFRKSIKNEKFFTLYNNLCKN